MEPSKTPGALPARPRGTSRWVGVAKAGLLLVLLGFVGVALWRALRQVDPTILGLRLPLALGGSAIAALSSITGAWSHAVAYRPFGHRLTAREAFVLHSVPSLGKYVPGKVASMAGQAAVAYSYGIPVRKSASVIVLKMGTGILTACLLGSVLLAVGTGSASCRRGATVAALAAGAILCGVAIVPGLYGRWTDRLLALFRRPSLGVALARDDMFRLQTALICHQGLLTLGLTLATLGFVDLPVSRTVEIMGALLLASVAGFVVVFAPAGLGVREGAFLALLGPVYGPGTAALLAVLVRPCQIVLDALTGTVGLVLSRRARAKDRKPTS